MFSAAVHRTWAREFLVRAEEAPTGKRKRDYLRLAARNIDRAQILEAQTDEAPPVREEHEKRRSK